MEYPYIALMWNPDDPRHMPLVERMVAKVRDTGHWHRIVQHEGLAVFAATPRGAFLDAYPLARQGGVVLGTLFKQSGSTRLTPNEISNDIGLAAACRTSRGAHLTSRFWGAYVALMSCPGNGNWLVLRDCSGMIPCYYTTARGVTVAVSDVRDLSTLSDIRDRQGRLFPFQINWRYVMAFLASSQMQIRETGLMDVYELLAGEVLECRDGRRTVQPLWNPVSIAKRDPPAGMEDACRNVRDTTRYCIESWAGLHRRILHSLSGGFDSSLVLALLMHAPRRPEVVCVNRFSSGPAEDERRYARLAAQAAGAHLIEHPWVVPALDEQCLDLPVTAKPSLAHLVNGLDAPFYNRICAIHSVDAIWTGQGGDHVFWVVRTALGAVDCWRERGAGPELLAALRETAHLTGRSLPHLLRDLFTDTLCRYRRSDRFYAATCLIPQSTFLSPDIQGAALDEYIRHPWAAESASLPPGKRFQVLLLAEVLNRHRPLYGLQDVQEFHPLLSQPLIELCLRIPVYMLLAGGRGRGLARRAFHDVLPAAIIGREQKGQTTHAALELFRRSTPFLRTLLLDGRLVNQGLLDRGALEIALTPEAPITPAALFPLFACIAAEAWLHGWISPPRGGPAKPFPGASGASTSHERAPPGPPCEARRVIRTAVPGGSALPNRDCVPARPGPPRAH